MNSPQLIIPSTQIEYALRLSRHIPIFPCSHDKKPLTEHGFHDASKDEGKIRLWWGEHPEALIGVPTGGSSGFLAIDYDPAKRTEATDDWIASHSTELIGARIHSTIRGGKHYLYRLGNGVRYRSGSDLTLAGAKRPGIDLRAEGGYIIWWPAHGQAVSGSSNAPILPSGLIDERIAIARPDAGPRAPVTAIAADWPAEEEKLLDALRNIDPEPRDTWRDVGMAISLETGGADHGFALWHRWSGGEFSDVPPASYTGIEDCREQWASFRHQTDRPVTLGTVYHLASEQGPKPLLLVPGAVEAVQAALPRYLVAGWDDLAPERVSGRSIDIWPVHDKAGYTKARALIERLKDMKPRRVRLIRPKGGSFQPGWAIGDALKAGWQGKNLEALIAESAGVVRPESLGAPKPKATVVPLEAAPDQPPVDLIPGTDMANMRRFIKRSGDEIRMTAQRGWLIWSGKRWQVDEKGALIARMAMNSAESMLDELRTSTDRDKLYAIAKAAAQKRAIEAVVWMARSYCLESLTAFDADHMIFNCQNGIVDLRTGALIPHNREAYCSMMGGAEFHPDATAPRWMQFLNEITMGNQELIDYLQRVCGYMLTGDVREQCLFFFHGGGNNGKTTFVETIIRAMGEYAIGSPTEMLMAHRNPGIPNDVARLRGVRACFLNETKKGQSFDEQKLKQLTGGDTLSARFLREEFFDFKPTHKLVLRGNDKPTVNGTDEGIWRRLRLIPWDLRLAPEQKDPALMLTLETELPGIFAWMVAGCLAWNRQGLGMPMIVKQASSEYREESDTLGRFIDEQCTQRPNAQVKASEIFRAYREFCDASGERALSAKDFPGEMEQRGFKRKRVPSGKVITGIELKSGDVRDWHDDREF